MNRVPSAGFFRRVALALGLAAAIAAGGCRDCNGSASTRAAPAPGGTSGAPGASSAASRPLRIAVIAKSASNPSFVAARTGAENRARVLSASLARPIEIEWLTPPQEDGAVQARRITQAVKEGMDAVLLSVSDARVVTPAIDDAVGRGVPVMTFDSDAPESRRFAYCGVDDVKAGEMIMEELARLVPRGAHVAVLAGNRAAPNLTGRVEGVLREAARHPDIKVVGTFYTVETPEEASATVIHVDAAHPDIEGWAMVGGWALYTKTLLHELQRGSARRRKPVKIVSINALPPQLAYVEAGLAPVLLAQPTYLWGEIGVDAIVDKLTGGKKFPARIPAELVRVSADNLGVWARQLRAWGFADVPEELLARDPGRGPRPPK
jgi:ribose transport system substrate-binding protein